jgi:hypothetical protein
MNMSLFNFQTKFFRRVEGIVAQTIIVEEGVKGFRCGLAKLEI